MSWHPLLWTSHHFFGLVALAFAVFIGARNRGSARVYDDGRLEFAPSRVTVWALTALILLLCYQAAEFLTQRQGRPLDLANVGFAGLLALFLLSVFPGTIVVRMDGLQQVYWLRKNKRIQWENIVEINTGKKTRTVTIKGADGTEILHSRQLADRSRLLQELKQHCSENLPPDFPRDAVS